LARRYNVVFIISDQHQAKATGCYGNKVVKTPNIDKLATRGIRFTKAYCPSPLCAPSRASIITGVRPSTHGALYHKKEANPEVMPGIYGIPEIETIGNVFRKKGYVTGAIGKLHVHGETSERDLGFDIRKHRFYIYNYRDYIEKVGLERKNLYEAINKQGKRNRYNFSYEVLNMDEQYNQDTLTVNSSLDFIEENKDIPFFLWVGLDKPHPSWILQKRWMKLYDPKEMPLPKTLWEQESCPKDFLLQNPITGPVDFILENPIKGKSEEQKIRNAIASYYANVTNMDANIGLILDKLEELHLINNTILIYVSDHGEMLFEHSILQKFCFYQPSVQVPLIISCPDKLAENKVCSHPTTLIDLFPTLMRLADIRGCPVRLEGESLYDVLTNKRKPNPKKKIYSEFHHDGFASRMVLVDGWKYIYTVVKGEEKTEQLYNIYKDSLEMNNLAYKKQYRSIKERFRKKVFLY